MDVRPGHWVELRVHGVSGTPPADSLLVKRVVRVAGDERGGFYQPSADGVTAQEPVDGRWLEAYHWGDYTSGKPTQARWILLLPFGVTNAAQFMLPPAGRSRVGRTAHAVAGIGLRVLGLAQTCLLVFSVALVAMNQVAWQWVVDAHHAHHRWVAAGALLPLLALLLLIRTGDVHGAGQVPDTEDPLDPGRGHPTSPLRTATDDGSLPRTGLADPTFYGGTSSAPALRKVHFATALTMLTLLVTWPAHQVGHAWATAEFWTGIGLVAALALTVPFLVDPGRLTATEERTWWSAWALRVGRVTSALALVAIALFVLAMVTGFVGTTHGTFPPRSTEPGVKGVAAVLLTTSAVALVVVFLATLVLGRATPPVAPGTQAERRRDGHYRRYALGTTAALAAAVGTFIGVGYAGAFTLAGDLVVTLLRGLADDGHHVGLQTLTTGEPAVIQRVQYAWTITVVLVGLLALWAVVRGTVVRATVARAAQRDFARLADGDAPPPTGPPSARDRVVGKAMYVASLKNHIPGIFAYFAGTGILLTIAAGLAEYVPGNQGWVTASYLSRDGTGETSWFGLRFDNYWFAVVGESALVVMAFGLALVLRDAERTEALRRGVNTVWDVVAFWPRAAHPFVPVAYSQFVVAQLRRRISAHLRSEHGEFLVLAAHSQGTLIAVATLLWLPEDERRRVGFLSFGSQVRQMFAHAFPAYVDPAVVGWIAGHHGWVNLYRDTDYIAGPVLSFAHHTYIGTNEARDSGHWPHADAEPDTFVHGTRRSGNDWRLLDPAPVVHGPDCRCRGPLDRWPVAGVLRKHSDFPADCCDWWAATSQLRATDAPVRCTDTAPFTVDGRPGVPCQVVG